MADTARLVLMYAVFPLWVAAGLADWACHRRTHIATTTGLPENIFHWVMSAQIGVGMLAVAFLETNGAVLAIVAAVFVVHELTVYWELRFTAPKRQVAPMEQMVHSFLELLPLVSLVLLAVMAWPEWGVFELRAKREPWPPAYLLGAFGLAVLFNALPLLEETWRCLKARTLPSPGPR